MKKLIACCLILVFASMSEVFAQISLSGTATNNSVCNTGIPSCPCYGKLKSLTVIYNGINFVTIKVYKKSDLSAGSLVSTFNNVSSGQILTSTVASGTFDDNTYFHITGTPSTAKITIRTKCDQTIIGQTFGPYTVVGYTDQNGIACNMNVCNGSIDLSASGGSSVFKYKWSNGSTSQDPIRLCPGTYTVTVTDNNNLSATQSFQVGQASPNINASAITTTNSVCNGGCTAECFESSTIPGIVNAKSTWTINQGAGTVTIRTTLAKTFVDNTYGTNAIGWPNGHTFSNLTGSDNLEIALLDANNVKKLEFQMDYISSGAFPSGYGTLGVTGGEGDISLGNVSDFVNVKTSLSENFNTFGYVLTTNSPATDANYTPNPAQPNWIYEVWYEATVKLSAFGTAGFGKPQFVSVHASPSKTGNNTELVEDKGCCAFNCNGSINLTVNSGTGPFSFKWSSGETTEDLANTCAGSYIVTITDANACTVSQTFTVGQVPASITASSTTTPNTECGPPCPTTGEQLCFESPTNPTIVNAKTEWSINQNAQTITIRTTLAKTFVDNTYGNNAIGWPNGHTFSNLTGSDDLQLALYDANGTKKIEFVMDYLSSSSTVPSGYKTLGVTGGEGNMVLGSSANVLDVKTSLSENFNNFGYVLTTNSPVTNANYTPNPAQPNWIFEVWYEATVNLSVFGSAGFGFPDLTGIHASPSKTGNNTEPVDSVHCIPPCIPTCDGSINVTVDAGTGPFSFKWSNGPTTEDLAGLCEGIYTVTITDAGGCTISISDTISTVPCDDGDPCTIDDCINDECIHTPVICDDQDNCTTDECVNEQCEHTVISCDDDDECTADLCINGQCENTVISCDDDDACTSDLCVNGQCENTVISCDDDDDCTADLCINGQCENTVISCDDDDNCTTDLCVNGQCENTAIVCNDNNPCTDDLCVNGQCSYTPTGLDADASGTNPSGCGLCDGTASVSASGGHPPYQYSWSTGATTQSIGTGGAPGGTTSVCLNSGNGQLNASGDVFLGDNYYSAGTVVFANNTVADILGTNDDDLYRTERNTGNSTVGSSFNYNIPVTNGQYEVELHFAELFFGVAGGNLTPPFTGKRKFDVSIEGTLVLDDYDVNADAGPATAVIKTFLATVNDGFVTIVLTNVVNRAKVNGICVTPHQTQGGDGLCAGMYTVTVTDSKGCTTEASVTLNSTFCNDNNPCTIDDCVDGECIYTSITCNDGNPCTTDACVNGQCVYTPIICNDGNSCTNDGCVAGQCVYSPINCNDGNLCTTDLCVNGQCAYTPITCNDNNSCTTDACVAGECVYTPINCNDGNSCTTDLCVNGQCVYTPVTCNDGNSCTTDLCVNGQCVYTPITCNDNNSCTTDACVAGQCVYTPISCNDGNSCTTDLCVNGQCIYTPITCNDGNSCTTDLCVNGECVYTPITCNDNNSCTTDACVAGQCIYTPISCNDGNSCTTDLCVNGQCVYTPIICNDGNLCTTDLCVNGQCQYTPILCNDNISCTTDQCINGQCVYTPGEINLTIAKTDVSCECVAGTTGLCKLDFAGLEHGRIVNTQYAAFGIHFDVSANPPGVDTLVIFNSFVTGTTDPDLEVDAGNLAIIPLNLTGGADGIVDNPNDNVDGGKISLLFDQPRTVVSFVIVDVDHLDGDPHAIAYDAANNVLLDIAIPILGDGSVQTVVMNQSGVSKLVINTHNSIGITNFIFDCDTVSCCDGTATAQPSGGNAPYTYLWSNGATTSSIDHLCPGQYCVTVTDSKGCLNVKCVVVGEEECDEPCDGVVCNDQNSCTNDICVNGICQYTVRICDDENSCTNDACVFGACVYTPIGCNDYNNCTTDNCVNGSCVYTPVTCNDNNNCTTDACVNGSCVYTPVTCNDNNSCTSDACVNGSCVYTPILGCNDCPNAVTSLTLVRPGMGGDVATLTNGYVVNYEVLCRGFSIRANACLGTVKSVKFILNGSTFRTESGAPYAINGDNAGGYIAWTPAAGTYTLQVIPYTGTGASGTAGTSITITFTVMGGTSCNDNNACTTDACNTTTGVCAHTTIPDCGGDPCASVICNDNNSCTTDACSNGQCIYTPVVCNDNNACTNDICITTDGHCRYDAVVCNDNNSCTTDACVNGLCVYTPIICNDQNSCTTDACVNGQCQYSAIVCNDQNSCTNDACVNGQCAYTPIQGCGGDVCSAFFCDDQNPCTVDVGNGLGGCTHTPVNTTPNYLKFVNTSVNSYNLKVLYGSTSSWVNQNVITGGNNMVCITLRDATTPPGTMSKVHIRMKGSSQTEATRITNNYPLGCVPRGWTTICIPLSNFPTTDFTALPYVEIFNSAAGPYELHILKIEFTGGTTPFVWFGDSHTNNYVNGNSATFSAQLVTGGPCNGGSKRSGEEQSSIADQESAVSNLGAYPVPFENLISVEYTSVIEGEADIALVDLLGQVVKRERVSVLQGENTHTLQLDERLASGVYFLRVQMGEEVNHLKLMKSK